MRTTLNVTTQPAAEPVSLALLKQHCRIYTTIDDALVTSYGVAARIAVEGYLSRSLITQTLLWTMRPESPLHEWRAHIRRTMFLPRAPVQQLLSVTVNDRLGNATVITAANLPVSQNTPLQGYIADLSLEPATLLIGQDTPLSGGSYLHWTGIDNLQVSFVAGYGTTGAAVPETINQAIMMTTANLYENRGDVAAENLIPKAAEWLLDNHRLQWFGG